MGFLFTSGLIKTASDIENITVDSENWVSHAELKNKTLNPELVFKRLYTSGCGRGTFFYNTLDLMNKQRLTSNLTITPDKVTSLMQIFQDRSIIFKKTGGVHSAALSSAEDILVFHEDIGRHNALDKVIGSALIKELNMENLMLLTSGRVSSEVIFKTAKTKASFLISRSAPTDQAVKIAKDINLTLVGFARGRKMNVYSGEERIEYE